MHIPYLILTGNLEYRQLDELRENNIPSILGQLYYATLNFGHHQYKFSSHCILDFLSDFLHRQNQDGDTALHILARSNQHTTAAQILVEACFDMDIKNKEVGLKIGQWDLSSLATVCLPSGQDRWRVMVGAPRGAFSSSI